MTEATLTREQIIRATAWGIPIVTATIAAPAAAASNRETPTMCVDTAGTYEVGSKHITVRYRNAPDIYELNVRGPWGSVSFGTNYGSAPKRGSKVWTVTIPGWPSWAQCHGFNAHYGEATCPARGGNRG